MITVLTALFLCKNIFSECEQNITPDPPPPHTTHFASIVRVYFFGFSTNFYVKRELRFS